MSPWDSSWSGRVTMRTMRDSHGGRESLFDGTLTMSPWDSSWSGRVTMRTMRGSHGGGRGSYFENLTKSPWYSSWSGRVTMRAMRGSHGGGRMNKTQSHEELNDLLVISWDPWEALNLEILSWVHETPHDLRFSHGLMVNNQETMSLLMCSWPTLDIYAGQSYQVQLYNPCQ